MEAGLFENAHTASVGGVVDFLGRLRRRRKELLGITLMTVHTHGRARRPHYVLLAQLSLSLNC